MSNFTLLGCLELVKRLVWMVVVVGGGLEGNFSVCFGPNPWIWTWTKLNKKHFGRMEAQIIRRTDGSTNNQADPLLELLVAA